MTENTLPSIPMDHPVRAAFHELTSRAMSQCELYDEETVGYVANLLIDFIHAEHAYRLRDDSGRKLEYVFEMVEKADHQATRGERRECYRYLGDWTLFNLGLFPESLTYGRRLLSQDYYAQHGRRSYMIVADLESNSQTRVFRKLSDDFQRCVGGLHWVKRYIHDPFYQYMFRQFQII